MTALKVFLLEFEAPYHVGFRRPQKIIDHVTILRALASMAYLTSSTSFIEAVKAGRVACTALLPTAKINGEWRALVPFPVLPCKHGKIEYEWITLDAALEVLKLACTSEKMFVEAGVEDDVVYVKSESSQLELKPITGGGRPTILSLNEGNAEVQPVFNTITEYHNRIDRVTCSADLYPLRGWRCSTPFWLAIKCEDEELLKVVDALLNLLAEMGLGGFRSRGWGKFRVREIGISEDDEKILEAHDSWKAGTYNLLLASTVLDKEEYDPSRSYVKAMLIYGRSGPSYGEHHLPVIRAAAPGSFVFVKREPKHKVYECYPKALGYEPFMVFNPIPLAL